ncbi:UNVERIFIED_CONTAM: hypothetical protein FKN15_013283 [Acipenser sinensis]
MGLCYKGIDSPLLSLLSPACQVLLAAGSFELQIKQVQNRNGVLWSGECCGGASTRGRCSLGDQCNTFFRVCLKEYQLRVAATGPCIFGTGATPVLGGNSFSLRHRPHSERTARILIPFQYAWPLTATTPVLTQEGEDEHTLSSEVCAVSRPLFFTLWTHHAATQELQRRRTTKLSSSLQASPQRSYSLILEALDYDNSTSGPAICKQGCHPVHGYCKQPGECSHDPHPHCIHCRAMTLIHTASTAQPRPSSTLHPLQSHEPHPHCIRCRATPLIHTASTAEPRTSPALHPLQSHAPHPHCIHCTATPLIHTASTAQPRPSSTLHPLHSHAPHPHCIHCRAMTLIHTASTAEP